MTGKHVYFFGGGGAEGGRHDRELLGGKGADLAEMARLGINVPPGFTVTTEACRRYLAEGRLDDEVRAQVREALARLEDLRGRRLGDPGAPLLVSVRSGAVVSMPGMMDTVLNLGCTREVVEGLARSSGNRRFALDTYRRLIQMFTNVVMKVRIDIFEAILQEAASGADADGRLPAAALEEVVARFLSTYEDTIGKPFPEDPLEQLELAIAAVFDSWNTPRARSYRQLYGIPEDLGTAANVQSMVFGNLNERSGSGVAFTRDPATGEPMLYGEWLPQAQGEDVVAGIRTPHPLAAAQRREGGPPSLEERLPEAFRELKGIAGRLERHYADMLDLEFTVEDGVLFLLQSRRGKRTGTAAVRIAVDLVAEGLIDPGTALSRVEPEALEQLLHPQVAAADAEVIAEGLPASPGAATGVAVFTAEEAQRRAAAGEDVILVRPMTVADDVGGMAAARGVLTARGGMTSHAAVVARGMGKPCVTGASALVIDLEAGAFRAGGRRFRAGDAITIDGTTGRVYAGAVPLVEPQPTGAFGTLMEWADDTRRLAVRANADSGADARRARCFGAEGIGLCRTEHMFFGDERLPLMQALIVAEAEDEATAALDRLEPFQRRDFEEIFEAMDGLPVTIRLLDPPLHEFLPEGGDEVEELARRLRVPAGRLRARLDSLREANPMLGHRGCRLGVTRPEIYRMQVRAILAAAQRVRDRGGDPHPEIMVPLVSDAAELRWLRANVVEAAAEEVAQRGRPIRYHFGAMIETPRACLRAADLAREADFFSFGTNDLTQLAFGFSRDDSEPFLAAYRRLGLLQADPFRHADEGGVVELVALAGERGRQANPRLVIGVCGEHGGDPTSIARWHETGLDYVSCSPYRVPVARLSAAQAALGAAGEPGATSVR